MKKQTVLLVFTLLWMAVIFGFSAKPAEESADMSLSVGRWIGQAFVPAYDAGTKESRRHLQRRSTTL